MAVLKFRAIDFDHCPGVFHQALGGRFHDASLARSSRPEKQEVPNGTPGRSHTREIHLIDIHDLLDRFMLSDDELAKVRIEPFRVSPGLCRIERNIYSQHCLGPLTLLHDREDTPVLIRVLTWALKTLLTPRCRADIFF